MNRTSLKSLQLAGLLIIVVACAVDQPTLPPIRAGGDCPSCQSDNALAFKVQVGSTWYSLTEVGDFIGTSSSSGHFTVRAQGVDHDVAASSISLDSTGFGLGIKQWYRPDHTPKQFEVNWNTSAGTIPEGGNSSGYADTLYLNSIASSGGFTDSTKWYWIARQNGNFVTMVLQWQSFFALDVSSGSFRFAKCSSTPTCSWLQ